MKEKVIYIGLGLVAGLILERMTAVSEKIPGVNKLSRA
jgi:hypothetical protein